PRKLLTASFARCGLLRDQRGPFTGAACRVLNEDRLEFLHDACLREGLRCRRTVKDAAKLRRPVQPDGRRGRRMRLDSTSPWDWRSAAFCPYKLSRGHRLHQLRPALQSPFVFANGPDVPVPGRLRKKEFALSL
uniref:POPLD domain-containing protein n=1 Tax=Macrostomum lignano TaxID=282301 RepID=A0A1I8FLQ3_9PLAT